MQRGPAPQLPVELILFGWRCLLLFRPLLFAIDPRQRSCALLYVRRLHLKLKAAWANLHASRFDLAALRTWLWLVFRLRLPYLIFLALLCGAKRIAVNVDRQAQAQNVVAMVEDYTAIMNKFSIYGKSR